MRDDDANPGERGEMTPQVAPDRATRGRVERRERLVEQKDARVDGQSSRKRDALRLATGEGTRLRLPVFTEAEPIEPGRRTGARVMPRTPARS